MEVQKAFETRIKHLCKEKNITINKLATLSGIEPSTLSSIVNGKSKNPKMETVINICAGLNMKLSDFFDDKIFENIEID